MTYSFIDILVIFWLTLVDIYFFGVYFSLGPLHLIKEIFYVNTNSKRNQPWNKNKEINILMLLKNPVYLM